MLTGAMRAARTAGVLRLERVWVVAVPVVVVVVLERIATLHFIAWAVGALGTNSHPYAELCGRDDPWPLRTTLVAFSFAVTGYVLLWAVRAIVEYAAEVKRRGRRLFLQGGATGRLVVFGSLFVILAYEMTIVVSLPTAEDVIAGARADLRSRCAIEFVGTVLNDVPGIRRLCREELERDESPRAGRLRAAVALTRLGAGSEASRDLLRSFAREEYFDPANAGLVHDLVCMSRGVYFYLPFRVVGESPELREKLWQEFRRECIP